MNSLSPYNKAIAGFLTAMLAWGSSVVVSSPPQITAGEWIQFAGVFVTTALVFLASNTPEVK